MWGPGESMERGGTRLLVCKVFASPLTTSQHILSEQNTVAVHMKYSDGKNSCDLGFTKIKIKSTLEII